VVPIKSKKPPSFIIAYFQSIYSSYTTRWIISLSLHPCSFAFVVNNSTPGLGVLDDKKLHLSQSLIQLNMQNSIYPWNSSMLLLRLNRGSKWGMKFFGWLARKLYPSWNGVPRTWNTGPFPFRGDYGQNRSDRGSGLQLPHLSTLLHEVICF